MTTESVILNSALDVKPPTAAEHPRAQRYRDLYQLVLKCRRSVLLEIAGETPDEQRKNAHSAQTAVRKWAQRQGIPISTRSLPAEDGKPVRLYIEKGAA